MKVYKDAITGYEIRQYTFGPERNAKLYFTSENFSPDDRYFYFNKQQLEGRTIDAESKHESNTKA